MKKTLIHLILMILIFSILFIACESKDKSSGAQKEAHPEEEPTSAASAAEEESKKISYEQITQEKAKELMDTQSDYIILDVREQEEYDEAHIKGAILIPDYEITQKAESVLTDKEQLILVYCRSGRRSKLAASDLAELGYVNVKEFGGIIDWQYGTVTD